MNVETIHVPPAFPFPNSALPALVYRNAVALAGGEIEARLRSNLWIPDWYSSDGMFPYHHFHSDSHEIIAVVAGRLLGKLGGDAGAEVQLEQGDVVVIPAGVAHIGLAVSDDLHTVGGYPSGHSVHDFRLGDPLEYEICRLAARKVPVPSYDPIHGPGGPVVSLWSGLPS